MNILISGDEGLIGKHISKYLQGNFNIYGIDLKNGENINNIQVDDKIDTIIHCAALCRIRECIKSPLETHVNNATGTLSIFEFARKNEIKNTILFSSSRVLYPERNIYTATKKYGEGIAKAYNQCYDINYKIIRPSTVFGELDSFDRVIPLFIKQALNNQDIFIYGNKKKTLDITYIDDFMDAFKLIFEKGDWNKEYNVGNGIEVKVLDIAKYIISETNSAAKIRFASKETAQPQNVKIDIKNIMNLGYKPRTNWQDGILKTIEWIKQYY